MLHTAERLLAARPDRQAAAWLDEARALVFRPPVEEGEARLGRRSGHERADIALIAAREAEWGRQAEANYARARRLAELALARLR